MRILAVMIGLVLVGFPLQLIYAMTVPVPQFRTGTYNDFTAFAATMGVIYGGAFVGIAIRWARNGTASRRVLPVEVLTAGVSGALALCAVFLVGSGVRSLITEGSFEKGIEALAPTTPRSTEVDEDRLLLFRSFRFRLRDDLIGARRRSDGSGE